MTSNRYPSKAAGEVVEWAKRYGWSWQGYYGNGHLRLVHRNGRTYQLSATPSDVRMIENAKATMHRLAGTSEEKPRAGRIRKGDGERTGYTGGPGCMAAGDEVTYALDELENIDGLASVLDPEEDGERLELLKARRRRYAAILVRHGRPVPPADY